MKGNECMFETACDACGAESAPYTEWPRCTDCDGLFCPKHISAVRTDRYERERGMCSRCGILAQTLDRFGETLEGCK